MSKSLRRQFLEANLQQVESFIRDQSIRPLERIGFEDRRDELMEELQKLGHGTTANILVSFDGEPVANAPGIDTNFAGEALIQFQNLVSTIDAAKTQEVFDTGRIPGKSTSKLRLVGTVLNSFGFELQEADPQTQMFASSLSDSVKSATMLIAAAAEGDEQFMAAAENIAPPVQTRLTSFLNVVNTANAVCKLIAEDTVAMLDRPHVAAAVERVTTTTIVDATERFAGKFGGARLDSRDFNHEINDLGDFLKGKVHEDVDRATMIMWDRKWLGKPCVAIVIRRTVSRLTKVKTTFTLKGVDPPEPEAPKPTKG